MKTLKLDSSFRPIEVVSALDAFCMVYMERANIVESYENAVWKSVNQTFSIPCVISLNRFVKRSKTPLACNKTNVLWRDRNMCQYCRKIFSHDNLTLDHVTPKSRGGPKSWDNIVASCRKCNQRKGNRLPHEAGMIPLNTPKAPPLHVFRVLSPCEMHPKWEPYLNAYGYSL